MCKSDFDTTGLKVLFFDGITEQTVFINSKNIQLNLPYYGKFSTVQIKNDKIDWTFIVENIKSQIVLTRNQYENVKNCIPALDSINNRIYAEILDSTVKERALMTAISKGLNDVNSGEKLQETFRNLTTKEISVISKYPYDNFAYWFYKNQIIFPSTIFLKDDIVYLRYIINDFNHLFRPSFAATKAHTSFINSLNYITRYPLKVGDKVDLRLFKIDYNQKKNEDNVEVYLLDFWATWCPPCLRSNVYIEKLNTLFTKDQLQIIKINTDTDRNTFLNHIKTDTSRSFHIYDKDKTLFNTMNSNTIPIFLLLDKEGEILFLATAELDTSSMKQMIEIIEDAIEAGMSLKREQNALKTQINSLKR